MHMLIEADGLTKRFGKVQALSGLNLNLPPGRAVAILGPNGAGKTTLIRMMATLLQPDSGRLMLDGHDVVHEPMAVRRMIGLAGQAAAVEATMTGRENLMMVARLYGLGRRGAAASTDRILAELDLTEVADRQVRTLSGGQRRRLDLGASLVGTPRLLLLDEPTTGLDPGSRNEVWDAIRAMQRAGTELLLTTQYLDEADRLAAYIVIVDAGRVIAEGTPDELKSRVGVDVVELHAVDMATMERAARVLSRFARSALSHSAPVTDPAARRCSISAAAGAKLLPAIVRALDEEGVPVEDISLRRPTLDEVFLTLTGRSTDPAGPDTPERDTTDPHSPDPHAPEPHASDKEDAA